MNSVESLFQEMTQECQFCEVVKTIPVELYGNSVVITLTF